MCFNMSACLCACVRVCLSACVCLCVGVSVCICVCVSARGWHAGAGQEEAGLGSTHCAWLRDARLERHYEDMDTTSANVYVHVAHSHWMECSLFDMGQVPMCMCMWPILI